MKKAVIILSICLAVSVGINLFSVFYKPDLTKNEIERKANKIILDSLKTNIQRKEVLIIEKDSLISELKKKQVKIVYYEKKSKQQLQKDFTNYSSFNDSIKFYLLSNQTNELINLLKNRYQSN